MSTSGNASYATFYIDESLYGINLLYLREIIKHVPVTRVPHAAEYISGLINLRGQVVTLIELPRILKNRVTKDIGKTSNIILRTENELNNIYTDKNTHEYRTFTDSVGLMVDQIDEIVEVDESHINPPPENLSRQEARHLEGIVELNEQLLSIISVSSLLSVNE